MQLSLLFSTARIKSLHGSRRTASAKDWADSLWRPQPHYRFYFISRFFGWRAVGISNPVRKEFSILFSLASAWARERLPFFFFFKKAGRFPPYRRFWLAARQLWPWPAFYFFTKRHRGSVLLVWPSPLSGCFCSANNRCKKKRLRSSYATRFSLGVRFVL